MHFFNLKSPFEGGQGSLLRLFFRIFDKLRIHTDHLVILTFDGLLQVFSGRFHRAQSLKVIQGMDCFSLSDCTEQSRYLGKSIFLCLFSKCQVTPVGL